MKNIFNNICSKKDMCGFCSITTQPHSIFCILQEISDLCLKMSLALTVLWLDHLLQVAHKNMKQLIAEHQKMHYTDKFSFVGKPNQESYVRIYGRLQQLC